MGIGLGLLGGIGGLGKRLKSRGALEAERNALFDRAEDAAIHHKPIPAEEFEGYTDPKKYLEHQASSAARSKQKAYARMKLSNIEAHRDHQSRSAVDELEAGMEAHPGVTSAAEEIIGGIVGRGRRRRRRTTRYGRSRGRSRRSRYDEYDDDGSPEGESLESAVPAVEHVAHGGTFGIQGATPGKLAAVGAAGVGAYMVTSAIMKRMGNASQAGRLSAERAGVQATLALHDALEAYKREHGAYPPPAQRAVMKQAWLHKLAEYGWTQSGGRLRRDPTAAESFLADYATDDEDDSDSDGGDDEEE